VRIGCGYHKTFCRNILKNWEYWLQKQQTVPRGAEVDVDPDDDRPPCETYPWLILEEI
jgi:hypothetical protein